MGGKSTQRAEERARQSGAQRSAANAPGTGETQLLLLAAFAQELVRCGMRMAVCAPGSRNTPLLLALCANEPLRCISQIDERAAGFFALGAAKASGLPVAVTCTSGTAAAELHPAVIEAREASVPLLVLSADRPAELRECGAGQAIDQIKLYGDAVKWFFEVELPSTAQHGAQGRAESFIRTLACRAFARALEGRPGPVHLNFPLREPLVTEPAPPAPTGGRPDGAPFLRRLRAPAQDAQALAELRAALQQARRPLLIAGRTEGSPAARAAYAAAAAELAERGMIPLLADPLSGARRGAGAIAHYDAILRCAPFAQDQRPDLVVRLGALPTSRPLRSYLAGLAEAAQLALDPIGDHQDPDWVLARSYELAPTEACRALLEHLPAPSTRGPAGDAAYAGAERVEWLGRWRAADERAAGALGGLLGDRTLSEPLLAAELGVLLPAEATLFVSSSMPVRDIESFFPVRADPPTVLCNRGANGIDGVIASAAGAAAALGGEEVPGPALALIGDVALAHDIGSLHALRRLAQALTIVLINNGGGAIFDFLPVARAPAAQAIYERQIATPPQLDFEGVARAAGLAYERPQDTAGFRSALEVALGSRRATLIEVQSERAANRRLHERAWEAVAEALAGL